MDFILALAPAFAVVIYMWAKLRKFKRHDKVLYRYCAVRRDAMQLLRNKGGQLDTYEYAKLRELIDTVGHTIHHFENHKHNFFNLRKVVDDAKQMKRIVNHFERQKVNNEEIEELYQRTSIAMIVGFFTYTPFLLLTMAKSTAVGLAFLGIQSCRKWAHRLMEFENWSRRHSRGHNLSKQGLLIS